MDEFCLDSGVWLDESSSTFRTGGGEVQVSFNAFDSSLGTKGGWESGNIDDANGSTFFDFATTLVFESSAPWPSDIVTSVSGVLELDLLATDLNGGNRTITEASATLEPDTGSSATVDEASGATEDFLFSSTNATAHTVVLPFMVNFSAELTPPLDELRFFFGAGSGNGFNDQINVEVIRFYDLCFSNDIPELFWTRKQKTKELPL